MRICLVSPEHGHYGGIGVSVARLGRLLARDHEVTVVHTYEDGPLHTRGDDCGGRLREVVVEPSELPDIAFSCDDHARSAATLAAIERAYGDSPPDYLEVPDYRGHGLVPLQARNAGHRSLRGTAVAVRLCGMAELISLRDGNWPPPPQRMVCDLEREALRLADTVLWPGGDLLELHRRCIDPALFEVAERLRVPLEPAAAPPQVAPPPAEGPLRILFVGRLQRVKGVLPLVEACLGAADPGWRLTAIGGDTNTAPLGQSVRATIETICDGDERVTILDSIPHAEVLHAYAEHDLLVVPSAFECWPNVALEGMRAGIPVLATAVGGLTEIVADGKTGWLLPDNEPATIRAALERLLANRAELERVRASGEIGRHFERLTDEEMVRSEYEGLLRRLHLLRPTGSSAGASPPLVTGVVTYFGEAGLVGEAVDSLLAQTYPEVEVLIVNDGSFEPEDRVLAELASRDRVRVLSEPNRGETAARNLGARDADGTYLAFLDADNTLEPEFVARAVAMLEADPDLAYVTCWLRFFDDGDGAQEAMGTAGFAALGNAVRSDEAINSDGDAIAVMPRRLFSRLGYRFEEEAALMGDWEFYRRLRDDGHFGTVMPELLANYRVRSASLSRTHSDLGHADAWDESLSRRRAAKLAWAADA
jgi:glycosyltransferase involved in cell wall biosynthesis